MARIRSIHPGFWTDEAYASVQPSARLLAIGIFNQCDDQGVFEWKPLVLKMRIMPADVIDVVPLLAELSEADVVRQFTDNGRKFGAVKNFQRYQNPKSPKVSFPLPVSLQDYVGVKPKDSGKDPPTGGGGSEQQEGEPPEFPQNGEIRKAEVAAIPPSAEITPQREEGGGKREEEFKKDSELRSDAVAPLIAPLNARQWLRTEGIIILADLTGRPPRSCHGLMGKLLKGAKDDCGIVREKLFAARDEIHPLNPTSWLMAAVKAPSVFEQVQAAWDDTEDLLNRMVTGTHTPKYDADMEATRDEFGNYTTH